MYENLVVRKIMEAMRKQGAQSQHLQTTREAHARYARYDHGRYASIVIGKREEHFTSVNWMNLVTRYFLVRYSFLYFSIFVSFCMHVRISSKAKVTSDTIGIHKVSSSLLSFFIHIFFTQAHQPNGDRHLISSSPLLQVSTCRTVCSGGFLFSREFVSCFSPHAHERTRKCPAKMRRRRRCCAVVAFKFGWATVDGCVNRPPSAVLTAHDAQSGL